MKRITIEDSRLFPVQAFFNAIRDDEFVVRVEELLRNIGHGYDGGVCCTFPEELDPGEEPFEGVEFSVGYEDVIIPRADFRHYLQLACYAYLESRPEDRQQLENLLAA